jgi:hypothetical protein
MRKYVILLLITIFSCKTNQGNKNKNFDSLKTINEIEYKVYKIDSIDNYYLVYAKKEESIYKIVSKKMNIYDCNRIKINSNYPFKLIPFKMDTHRVGDTLKINLPRYEHSLLCYNFDGVTQICVERYMSDLYFAENVKGLCLIKE